MRMSDERWQVRKGGGGGGLSFVSSDSFVTRCSRGTDNKKQTERYTSECVCEREQQREKEDIQ